MNCANPACRCGLFDRPGGSIWLMQLELPREDFADDDSGAFTLHLAPTRCFWLCAECSRQLVVLRWTPAGVCLAPRPALTNSGSANRGSKPLGLPSLSFHASARIEEEFLDIG